MKSPEVGREPVCPKRGVILVGMGGVSGKAEIRPFLLKLFSDHSILPLPYLVRMPLAWGISTLRAPKVAKQYDEIGYSPFKAITQRQADALSRATALPVVVGMQYSSPSVCEAMETLKTMGVEEAVVLPLYPQFSYTTTASALAMARKAAEKTGISVRGIEEWSTLDGLVAAWVDRILPHMEMEPYLLFSAHSIPNRWVKKGDPYPGQVMDTVRAVVRQLGTPKHTLAYQSAVGPVNWLGPSVEDALKVLKMRGVPRVLVVPVSFICEHFETLYELKLAYARLADGLGFSGYQVVEALNDHPLLVEGWKSPIKGAFGDNGQGR